MTLCNFQSNLWVMYGNYTLVLTIIGTKMLQEGICLFVPATQLA